MNYTKNTFAIWLLEQVTKNVQDYQFDIFYDIELIVNELKQNRSESNQKIEKTFFLFLRSTGSNLISNQESIDFFLFMKQNNEKCFKITFCFNADYFADSYFAKVTEI